MLLPCIVDMMKVGYVSQGVRGRQINIGSGRVEWPRIGWDWEVVLVLIGDGSAPDVELTNDVSITAGDDMQLTRLCSGCKLESERSGGTITDALAISSRSSKGGSGDSKEKDEADKIVEMGWITINKSRPR
jgi:hypothetical protein